MDILTPLVYLTVLSISIGELARIHLAGDLVLNLLDVIALLTVIVYIIQVVRKKINLPKKEIILTLSLFPFFGLVSLIINSFSLSLLQFLASMMYLFRWIVYAMLFFVIVGLKETSKKRVMMILIADSIFILIVGFLQYLFYPSLQNLYYLGWDDHVNRLFSVFFDPNFAGAFLVFSFLLFTWRFFQNSQEKRTRKHYFFGILSFLSLLAIFLTHSRSALVMLFVSSCILFYLLQQKKIIIMILLFIVLIFLLPLPKRYTENSNLFRITSLQARVETTQFAFNIITNHPFIGVGFNTLRYVKEKQGLSNTVNAYLSHADSGLDNSFLFVLATTGGIGFIMFAFLWVSLLKRLFNNYRKDKSFFAIMVIASVLGLFVDSLFINSLFYPVLMVWIWILLGLSIGKEAN